MVIYIGAYVELIEEMVISTLAAPKATENGDFQIGFFGGKKLISGKLCYVRYEVLDIDALMILTKIHLMGYEPVKYHLVYALVIS